MLHGMSLIMKRFIQGMKVPYVKNVIKVKCIKHHNKLERHPKAHLNPVCEPQNARRHKCKEPQNANKTTK